MADPVTDISSEITALATVIEPLTTLMGSNILIAADQVASLGQLALALGDCANAAVEKSQTVATDPEAPPSYEGENEIT